MEYLPSRLSVSALAWNSVLAAGRAIAGDDRQSPDPLRIAAAYRSDRHLRIDGAAPEAWAPLSGFWKTADGWVRTHGNYPHHARALLNGLMLPAESTAEDVRSRLENTTPADAVSSITTAGGLCVPVRQEDPHQDAALRQHPLVEIKRVGDAAVRPLPLGTATHPLNGVRVLDLTRVIAGPVATRTLAFAGAHVLRIDPPQHPEFAWQHLDTGHGKYSALLDIAADPARFERLAREADAIVLGYRPDGLRRLGLSSDQLAARHPHLVIAQLSAWPGDNSPRGFDSLVQAESGIAWIESLDGGQTPGTLPAQALDHSAGYLLAAGIATALRRRASDGGTWHVRTSLRRVAAELLGMPRRTRPADADTPPTAPDTQLFRVGDHQVETVRPAVTWVDAPQEYAAPHPWGSDAPEW